MKWIEAKKAIEGLKTGTDINTSRSTYREVIGPDRNITSKRYDYKNEEGIILQIGDDSYIKIPYSVFESCYNALGSDKGYNGDYFRKHYPLQAKDHGCHIHAIGMCFVKAGIAEKRKNSYFLIER